MERSAEKDSDQTMDYAQVIFHNVAENYPPDAHIQCSYTLTKSIEPNKNDWVGLFKIGWSTTREKITYDWAPMPNDWQTGQEYKLNILFNSYYLPKDDGEFYQFCYIDRLGKMRGASTPFQFLHLTDVEFVEIDDEYEDMLMIQSKTIIQEEKLKRAIDEKEKMVEKQKELENAKDELEKQLAETSKDLTESNASIAELTSLKQELSLELNNLENQRSLLETNVGLASDKIKKLEEENARYKTMLESTEADLQEVVANNNTLSSIRDQLTAELMDVKKEKDQYKEQFLSSEQEVKALEVLLQDMRRRSEKSCELKREHEDEKKKIEKELLVARADRDYLRSNENRLEQVESQLAATQQTKSMLTEEISTLKTVQHKLSKDLENASIEKDHVNDKLLKTREQFRKKEATLQQKIIRQEHAFREKEGLLQEQLEVMRQSMNKLAKDHEKLQKNVKDTVVGGPSEALRVALDDITAKLKRRQIFYDQLFKEKVELEKKLIAIEQEKTDLIQERNDYKTRLGMAAEEYKSKFLECHQLQRKLNKVDKRQQKEDETDEAVRKEASTMLQQACEGAVDKGTQSGIPAVALKDLPDKQPDRDNTFDINEVKQQLHTMEEELTKRDNKIKKYKKLYQEEKIRNEEQCSMFSNQMKDLHNRLMDETQVKEAMKKDFDRLYQEKEFMIQQLKVEVEALKAANQAANQAANHCSSSAATQEDPVRRKPSIYVNPYAKDTTDQVYDNPYTPRPKHVVVFQPKREANNLDVGGSEEVSLLPPRNPPATMNLPEPLEPVMTQGAKIAAMKNVIQKTTVAIDELDPVQVNLANAIPSPAAAVAPNSSTQDDDKEDVAVEFHDAPEFPVEPQIRCPECQLVFPPSTPPQYFIDHVTSHAGKQCPMCEFTCTPEKSQEEFEAHVQQHFRD